MKDPALGRTRGQRALGDYENPDSGSRASRSAEFQNYGIRNVNNVMFSGTRPSYGRYQVSEQAQDILNRQNRSYNK